MGFLDTNARNPDITIAGITLALQFGVELKRDSIQNNIHEASCQDTSFSLNDRCCICRKSFFLSVILIQN